MAEPIVPDPLPEDVPKLFYKRSLKTPRAIAWFGFRSFWGHLWHLAASVVATEDIDSRDWMAVDEPDVLTRRIVRELSNQPPSSSEEDAPRPRTSLTEALDRDVFIDFLADTGDDFAVSKVVAEMTFAEYRVADPLDPSREVVLPRGDLLIFGGDTAYPVATDIEIHRRVIVPFNQVLRNVDDDKRRVLLGIPGNHDWYAGLDGFGRMFRRRRARLDRVAQEEAERGTDDEVDYLGQIGHFFEWVEAFRVGDFVAKRAALALVGYHPVQTASYFAVRLAPKLDLWGIDRQLRNVDFQQRGFFAEQRSEGHGIVLCLADPAYAFLEPNPTGMSALRSIDLDVERDGIFVLTGDTHHYCRQSFGPGVHVVAGGGGAFLHPACIARLGKPKPDREFPGPRTSLALALQVPWQIVHGRSGFIIHALMAIAYAPVFFAQWWTGRSALVASIVTGIVVALVCIGLGGWRQKFLRVLGLSLACGAAVGFMPFATHEVTNRLTAALDFAHAPFSHAAFAFGLSVYVGTLAIGTYLMLLTILGIEQHQALAALAHPGYKHFVRVRVRKDGSACDAWVFGKVDTLDRREKVVLVDHFTWKNPKA